MTIDEYVATLSEEEKELHKDLIQECREREAQNNTNQKEHYKLLRFLVLEERGQLAEAILKGTMGNA